MFAMTLLLLSVTPVPILGNPFADT